MANVPAPRASGYAAPQTFQDPNQGWAGGDGWAATTHTVSSAGRAHPAQPAYQPPLAPQASQRRTRQRREERGAPGWMAVVVLIAVAGLGGVFDLVRGSAVKGGFNIALVIASIIAIVVVRRSAMFSVVVAPPLVYFVASAAMLYVRSDGLSNRSRMLDAAINWLVYGFPAIAGATAAVLIIAGVRMIAGR